MTLTSKPLSLIILVILFGGIFFTTWMGWWQTESSKVAATFETGEYAGQANPADIRGSYTFGDVEKNFRVPAVVLAEAFGILTETPASFAVKELEEMYSESGVEIGTSSVRLFVAFYMGLPFDLDSDIYLPESAATLLEERELEPERRAYLESHTALPGVEVETIPEVQSTVEQSSTALPTQEPAPTAEKAATQEVDSSEGTIRGKTTFQELLDWGLSQTAFEEILGAPVEDLSGTVKDFCTANGLNFETLKPLLQAALDQLK